MRSKLESYEHTIIQKELEFSALIENKDLEINNLSNNLRDISLQIKQIEDEANYKMNELFSQLEEKDKNIYSSQKEIEIKNKTISGLEKQIHSHQHILTQLEERIKQQKESYLNLEEINKNLKRELEEVICKMKILSEELNIVKIEKDRIVEDKVEFAKNLQIREKKIAELKEIISTNEKIYRDIKRERKHRDISEKTNKELINELNETDETHQKELQSLRNNFLNIIENLNYEKQSILQEMKEIRQICSFVEQSVK